MEKGNTLRKEVVQRLFVIAVMLSLVAVPVAAEGNFFSHVWDWVKFFFTSSPTGGVIVDPDGDSVDSSVDNCPSVANAGQENVDSDAFGDACDGVYAFSPPLVAQGATVTVTVSGNFAPDAVFGISGVDITSQGFIDNTTLTGTISVPLNATTGSFDVSVGSDVLAGGVIIVPGPFDAASLVVTNTTPFKINISTANGIDKSSINITDATLAFFNNLTSETIVLNVTSIVDPSGTFILSFQPYNFSNGTYLPTLSVTVASLGLTVQSVSVVALPMAPMFLPADDCGNGIIDFGEVCDPPLSAGPGNGCPVFTTCSPFCNACLPIIPICGNLIVEPPETCDPPFSACGPGGIGTCALGCTCVLPPGACGNGIIELGETCELPAIGCPPFTTCVACNVCIPILPAVCGNGVLEGGEGCDDGNIVPCDGCGPTCENEFCGDGFLCPPEECETDADCPPGDDCIGCSCQPPHVNGGGGKGGQNNFVNTICIPYCEGMSELKDGVSLNNQQTWDVEGVTADGKSTFINNHYPTFEACVANNYGKKLNAGPYEYLDTFTHVAGNERVFNKMPGFYPKDDAAFFEQKLAEFKSILTPEQADLLKIADKSGVVCGFGGPGPETPAGPHLVALSKPKCQIVSGPTPIVKLFWERGWIHTSNQKTDLIDFLSTGSIITAQGIDPALLRSPGSRPDLEQADVGGGIVDGRTDKCKKDATECTQMIKKEFADVPEWSISFKMVAQDTLGAKVSKEATLTRDDCQECPLYVEVVDELGKLKQYPNPCCDLNSNVPQACCENKLFVQDREVAGKKQCYELTRVLDGPKETACLAGVNRCDIRRPSYLTDTTEPTYRQFDWVPVGQSCENAFNPFEQSFEGDVFAKAKDDCPQVGKECTPGEIGRKGNNEGNCRLEVDQCDEKGHWQTIQPGVPSKVEVCNREDDDCNGEIDDSLLCPCKPGETKQCTLFSNVVATCTRSGVFDMSACDPAFDQVPEIDKQVGVAEVQPGKFAVLTANGLSVPCNDNAFAWCVASQDRMDGQVVFNKISSNVPAGFGEVASFDVDNCDGRDVEFSLPTSPVYEVHAVFEREAKVNQPVGMVALEKAEQLPTALRTDPGGPGGISLQQLFDKSTIPVISYSEVKEATVLSKESPTISALGVAVTFTGDFDGVKVHLENVDPKVKNKALVVIGTILKMSFENVKPGVGVRIAAPLLLRKGVNPDSLGLYVLRNDKWEYVGGRIEDEQFVLDIADVNDYLTDSAMTFMVAGSTCDGCTQAYLYTVRDVNSPVVVVLVHGFFSSPARSWSALIKQFSDENINANVAVLGYAGVSPKDAAAVLTEKLREKKYEKVVFIAHSLGGLVVREFLRNEEQRDDSLIPNIEAVIMAGVPNEGTPIAGSVKDIFDIAARLLGAEDSAPIAGVTQGMLDELIHGASSDMPSSVKVFALTGTGGFLGIDQLFHIPQPNDGLVSVESANKLGSIILNEPCVNEHSQKVNHFRINKNPDQMYTLLYFLRQLSSEFSQRAPAKLYVVSGIKNCQKGVLKIYGKPLEESAMPPPKGCEKILTTVDNICQLGENSPDCKPPSRFNICGVLPETVYISLILSILSLIAYAVIAERSKRNLYVLGVSYSALGIGLIGIATSLIICKSFLLIPAITSGIVLIAFFLDYVNKNWRIKWH